MNKSLLIESGIKEKIHTIRGVQIILDEDLAELYDVSTKRLNEQVKRNIERFPERFMFQLTEKEFENLRSQIVTSKELKRKNLRSQNATLESDDMINLISQNVISRQRETRGLRSQIVTLGNEDTTTLRSQIATSKKGGRTYLPYAFTEQGVAMLSGVLKSETAIRVSIQIMEAFVSMRKFISENVDIFFRLNHVEQKQLEYDKNFEEIFNTIQSKNIVPDKGIFFEGQIFDAYKFIAEIHS